MSNIIWFYGNPDFYYTSGGNPSVGITWEYGNPTIIHYFAPSAAVGEEAPASSGGPGDPLDYVMLHILRPQIALQGGAYEYGYDAYSVGWPTDPANMTDGDLTTFAEVNSTSRTQTLTTNTAASAAVADDTIVTQVRIKVHGLAGHKPTDFHVQPVFNGATSGSTYDLIESMQLSDTQISVSAGLGRHNVWGIKPGKRVRPGQKYEAHSMGAIFCTFDEYGNFWSADSQTFLPKDWSADCGIFSKCESSSSWVRERFEPSAAKHNGGILNDTYPMGKHGSWRPLTIFWNSTTHRIGNIMYLASSPYTKYVIEYSQGVENGGDYPQQLVVEKELLLTGHSWSSNESPKTIAYEPTTDSYIIGTFQSAGHPWYSFDATTGALRNKRTKHYHSQTYGAAASGGLIFLLELSTGDSPYLMAADPITLGAPKTTDWDYAAPSAIHCEWRGVGGNTGDLAAHPNNGTFYIGDGSQWKAQQKWTRNGLISYSFADYSDWIDITNDANAPATWTWTDVENLDIRVKYNENTDGGSDNFAKVSRVVVEATIDDVSAYQKTSCHLYDNVTDMEDFMPVLVLPSSGRTDALRKAYAPLSRNRNHPRSSALKLFKGNTAKVFLTRWSPSGG